MKYLSLMFCLLVLLLFGCKEGQTKDEKKVRDFVKEWNETHTQQKSSYLQRYYMDVVSYYGKERTKIQVQKDKDLLLNK